MPGGSRQQISNIWRLGDIFWQKMDVLEASSPEPIRLLRSEILQNIPEPLTKL